jgi:cytochrome c biogenesis protein CcdA
VLLVVGALLAGVLTTLAPCVLPVLPVVLGGTLAPATAPAPVPAGAPASRPASAPDADSRRRALLVVGALGASVVVFTLLLKATTALLHVPSSTWALLSGGVLVLLGLDQLFPDVWPRLAGVLRLTDAGHGALAAGRRRGGTAGALLTGAALGPVFSSCSPTYAYVVATVLPASFGQGLVLLLAYVLGMCATLLVVAVAGQRLVRRLRWTGDPRGLLRRVAGALFVLVGIAVASGVDRNVQAWLVEHNPLEVLIVVDEGFVPGR